MTLNKDLALRDFDGESEDTDSETELLIRHNNRSVVSADGQHHHHHHNNRLTNTQQRSQRYGGSYSQSNNNNNSTHQPAQQARSFLSQLFGVVGGTTKFSNTSSSLQNLNFKQTPQPPPSSSTLLRSATASSLARDGQIRFRNERSRERGGATSISNITASQASLNNAAQAAKYGSSNTKSYNLNSDHVDSNAVTGSFHYSDSLQMSDMMDTQQPNITTTTSPNGVMQTVIDPENGSTTVFYQKNRRKSKKRSFGNFCKMCLCG